MSAVLAVSFEVRCSLDHAFTTWTSRIGAWWPRDHTMSGQPDAAIFLQDGVGGRIFERTADGREYEWGEITGWDPPHHLTFSWRLGGTPVPTEVEIRFLASGEATRVEIEHRGWERMAEAADTWRERNRLGWQSLIPPYRAAVEVKE